MHTDHTRSTSPELDPINARTAHFDDQMKTIIDRVRTDLSERDIFIDPDMSVDVRQELDAVWDAYIYDRSIAEAKRFQDRTAVAREDMLGYHRDVKHLIAHHAGRLQAMLDAIDGMSSFEADTDTETTA